MPNSLEQRSLKLFAANVRAAYAAATGFRTVEQSGRELHALEKVRLPLL